MKLPNGTNVFRVLANCVLARWAKGRLVALFLLVIFITPLLFEPVTVMALSSAANPTGDTLLSTKSAPALKPVQTKTKPASDTPSNLSPTSTQAATALGLTTPLKSGDLLSSPRTLTKTTQPQELISQRTAFSDSRLNSDGSIMQRQYASPHYYKDGKNWQAIDTTLIEDKNAADSRNVVGKLFGQMVSVFRQETTFTIKANDWKARFAPTNDSVGMVRITDSDSQISFTPARANRVVPKLLTDKNGDQSIWYYNVWSGVDIQYLVTSSGVKENILLNNKRSANSFSFNITGGQLSAVKNADGTISYSIKGALDNQFMLAPLVISLHNYGLEARQPLTQTLRGNQLTVSIDTSYLKTLPTDAFPLTLDPTITRSAFGTRTTWGNYMSFKSDGYVCGWTVCNPYAGGVQDSRRIWRVWRSAIHSPYSFLRGKILMNANLHLTQRLGLSSSGPTTNRYFTAAHATCLAYGCVGQGAPSWSLIGTSGNINVTDIYRNRIARGDWGAWLMLMGEEVANTTYKQWDPDYSFVDFTYASYTPTPSIETPVNNQTFVDPQVSLRSNLPSNPNSGTPLRFNFCVSTGQYCNGTVVNSGDLTSNQWTVPDGVLQDGDSYFVQVRALDPDGGGGYSGWSTPVAFKIDMRRGKDKTQSYDTVGPVDVDLATGNLSTGNTSHTSSALGGSLGVSLDYNSPLRSRNGLVGEYFNNGNLTGSPVLTRVDQNVDFAWTNGAPSSTLPTDNFSARWTGYFVAPKTGDYQFGSDVDDGCRIWVDGKILVDNWTWCGGQYGATVSLTAGQIVPIKMEYREIGGWATARLMVKGVVNANGIAAKKDWLQTGARPLTQQSGLTGRYYNLTSTKNLDASGLTNFLTRTDPLLSMSWDGSPIAGGAKDFMARWTGYITLPTSGTYSFGTVADDGSRIKIDGNTVMDNWSGPCCSKKYGGGVALTAGTHSITVDMYDTGGPAGMYLYVSNGGVEQVVPSSWLSTKAQVLPNGWALGVDPDGDLSYDRLTANTNSVVLSDSTGDTHEYTWTGSGYKPPVNEDGYLVRNGDGSFTLSDDDGKTYIFNSAGVLTSVTMPVDDRHPAALSYSYSGSPAKIRQISDGVDPTRNAKVFYSGDTECGTAPSGFDSKAPSGMLCAVITNDGRATYFYYVQGNLSRIVKPGNEATDHQYDTLGRIVSIRDSVANDTINAGVRAADDTVLTQITYDELGRAKSVIAPAATATSVREQQAFDYLPGNDTYAGATLEHIVGDAEPNGYSRRVEYDSLFRTTKDFDATAMATTQEWDPVKDLPFSSTDATGLKSTTIYDTDDRPIDSYGPAPSAWFGADRRPLATYATQVPHTSAAYDEGISGLAVAWNKTSSTTGSLIGAPLAHSTGINPTADKNWIGRNFATTPLPTEYNLGADYGFSATGKVTFPTAGQYAFKLWHDDGARLWINDQLIFDDWGYRSEGIAQNAPTGYFNAEAGKLYRFRLDYAHFGTPGALELWVSGPGITDTYNGLGTSRPSFFRPDYSLQTSSTTYDAQLGNITAKADYGVSPELGLATSTTLDTAGLNLKSTASYEPANTSGFLRQTSTTLPGGVTTNYAYYTATQTADNPCTTAVEAYKQGGQLRLRTDPDPDRAGPLAGRITETIYDDSGAIVATRYNNEAWTCNTYDSRGRTTITTIPVFNNVPARTVTNNYAVNGNPLVVATTDSTGTITVETDLLGRVVKYTDAKGTVTTSSYDDHGHLVKRVAKDYTESYVYDNFDRLTQQKLNDATFATVTYDAYSRIANVDYANGLSLSAITRDDLGRVDGLSYRLASGQTLSDQVVRTTTGDILSGTELGQAKQYTYDNAGRLTAATIAGNTFGYSYGAQAVSCDTSANPNAGMDSNRMSQTMNGASTSFCYDYADRLVSSSSAQFSGATYDAHGNATALGIGSTKTNFDYDSSDRLSKMTEAGKGLSVSYERDSQGRITTRTETAGATTSTANYGYSGSGDSPDFLLNAAGQVTEVYATLPGNVTLTYRPLRTSAGVQTWNLPNIHGDIFATVNADGSLVGTTLTGPYGEQLTAQQTPNNLTGSASYSYLGQYQKQTETAFTLQPIDMGARTYIPGLGRFLQMDPVKGGTPNDFMYTADPVNETDLSGQFIPALIIGALYAGGLIWAGYDMYKHPSPSNAAWLAVAALPGVAALRYGGKGAALGSKLFPRIKKTVDVKNLVRVNKSRIALGPSRSHYNKGGIFGKVPYHFEASWKNKKIFLENVKTKKTIFCKGRKCY